MGHSTEAGCPVGIDGEAHLAWVIFHVDALGVGVRGLPGLSFVRTFDA